jgi:hypothetical protein
VACAACGGRAEPPPVPSPETRDRVTPPQVLLQAQPALSDADAEALWAYPGTVRVVLRVSVRRDGTASGSKIVSAEPAEAPEARAFAEAVLRSLPEWRFRPATRRGQPVDAEMDLTMEAEGGIEEPAAR